MTTWESFRAGGRLDTPAPEPAPADDAPASADDGVGTPITLDPEIHPCHCVTDHNPNPRLNHRHHIVPLSWGGPNTADNVVPLCPTSHENLHALLRQWVRAGRPTATSLHPFVRDLALRAWDSRDTDTHTDTHTDTDTDTDTDTQ